MANFVDTFNESEALGLTTAELIALMNAAAVPVPKFISDLGLRVVPGSDVTAVTVAPTVRRTVRLAFGPTVDADGLFVLKADGEIQNVNLGLRGIDYIRPPIVTIDPGIGLTGINAQLRAFLNAIAVVLESGGAGYPGAATASLIGGLPPADTKIISGCVSRIAIQKPGLGYAAGTVCLIEGGGNGGSTPLTPAKATCTLNAFGQITSVTLTDMGAGYFTQPVVNFVPPTGIGPQKLAKANVSLAEGTPARVNVVVAAGAVVGIALAGSGSGYVGVPDVVFSPVTSTPAVARVRMQVERVDVRNPGIGYTVTAVPVFTPFFKNAFPNASNQGRPFSRFMELLLRDRAVSPMRALTPVLI